mmetsp:Transcript_37727/g.57764  ORF Transcript_37727/g.57764 Transcript_37727/m.57764 type:complete len:239 (+) Transcript_37727:1927-2643(+)
MLINYMYVELFRISNFEEFATEIDRLEGIGANTTYFDNVEVYLEINKDDNFFFYENRTEPANELERERYSRFRIERVDQIPMLQEMEMGARNATIDGKISDYKTWNMYGILISVAMMFYVLTKLIFNIFATIKLPVDKWSLIDIFCAFTNISCFIFLNNIDREAVMDTAKKQIYNFLMILTIIATWMRVIGIFFVVKAVSKLLMTIIKMLGSATTFLFIVLCYLLMMGSTAIALFQEI